MFNGYSRIISEAKYKTKYGEGLKVLTPKQMLQRLSIALAQVKAGNISEFMNSKNSGTSDPHRQLLNLTDKINLKSNDEYIALLSLIIYDTWKNIKKSYSNNKFKISAPTWNEEFELPDGSYSVSDIQDYLEYIFKSIGEKTDTQVIGIYVNKIENKITFKMKTGFYLELLTPETMKLLASTKSKITKDKNGENVPCIHLFLINHFVNY